MTDLAIHVRELCEFIREPDGECGCHLLAPEDGPCPVCEAESALAAHSGQSEVAAETGIAPGEGLVVPGPQLSMCPKRNRKTWFAMRAPTVATTRYRTWSLRAAMVAE